MGSEGKKSKLLRTWSIETTSVQLFGFSRGPTRRPSFLSAGIRLGRKLGGPVLETVDIDDQIHRDWSQSSRGRWVSSAAAPVRNLRTNSGDSCRRTSCSTLGPSRRRERPVNERYSRTWESDIRGAQSCFKRQSMILKTVQQTFRIQLPAAHTIPW